ncbi:MAG TPA: nucleotidyl transferase AbiEii/AbiGii toxin family protein [Candidatus Dormibacteraeota bacterium]
MSSPAVPVLCELLDRKGGTCLRKCYYETYRFSEDLDFTLVGHGPETPEELVPIFRTAGGVRVGLSQTPCAARRREGGR